MIDNAIDNVKASLGALIWGSQLATLPAGKRGVVRIARIVHMLVRELHSGDLTLRAASLTFTTLLSFVPLLAVSFSLLKGFGVHNKLEQALFSFLAPLGTKGEELAQRVLEFVDNVKAGVLGGVGLLLLILMVLSLVQKVEAALNHTWRVGQTRRFVQRFSGYLSVLLVGPLLVFAALGVIGTIAGSELVRELATIAPFGSLLAFLPKLVPFVLVVGAFSFVYTFIPNTYVRASSALIGAAVAGLLWATAGWAFAAFIVSSPSSNYTAIYSSFAIVFFFMLWLYVAWLILLVGGTVAFYHQHPEYLGVMPGELRPSNRLRERIAFASLARIGGAHLRGEPPVDPLRLAGEMRVPTVLLQETLQAMAEAGFVVEVQAASPGFVPARDISTIKLGEIYAAVRRANEHRELVPDNLPSDPLAEGLLGELEAGADSVLGERTLRDLLEQELPADGRAPGATVALKQAR